MKTLKESFRLNGLQYTLLKRNEVVALYGIGGTYTDKILHYEVDIIYTRKDKYGTSIAIILKSRLKAFQHKTFYLLQSVVKYKFGLPVVSNSTPSGGKGSVHTQTLPREGILFKYNLSKAVLFVTLRLVNWFE